MASLHGSAAARAALAELEKLPLLWARTSQSEQERERRAAAAAVATSPSARLKTRCAECGAQARAGKLGDGEFAGMFFCSHCWAAWEQSFGAAGKVDGAAPTHGGAAADADLRKFLGSLRPEGSRASPAAADPTPPQRCTPRWESVGVDVLFWLTGLPLQVFLHSVLGRRWHVARHSSPRASFTVDESLRLLSDFDPGPDRLRHCQRMQRYYGGAGRARVDSPAWAEGPLKFWSAVLCRQHCGVYEDIDDEARIAAFLAEHKLRAAEDLRRPGEQWTIVLNQVHGASPSMRALHQALWCALGISGGINSYLTPAFAAGKAPHVDEHDVLVLQQEGRKTWRLLAGDLRTTLHEVTLEPGDVLYLPQGIPHCAYCVSDWPSLHLAVSVSRSSLTGAGLLAACLVNPTGQCVEPEAARRTEEVRRKLAALGGPWDAAGQLPAPHILHPLLRALDGKDVPAGLVFEELRKELLDLGQELATRAAASDRADVRALAGPLRSLSAGPASFWAWREHLFDEHYMIHLPMALPDDLDDAPEGPGDILWRRPADAAALLTADGTLLVNGYRLTDLHPELWPIVRYCLGVHTGAAGQPFDVGRLAGPPGRKAEAVRLLARYRGLAPA